MKTSWQKEAEKAHRDFRSMKWALYVIVVAGTVNVVVLIIKIALRAFGG